MGLDGKLTIITGAASGIGRAAALLFAERGARIVAVDRDEAGLASLGQEATRGVTPLIADLADAAEVERVIAEAIGVLGGLDILWNHAGAFLEDGTANDGAELDFSFALNVRAGYIATRLAVPWLERRGGGCILFTSSTSGLGGSATSAVYSASKFAVVGMAKSLALRYAARNIRVNAICPGPIDTPMQAGFMATGKAVGRNISIDQIAAAVPMGRMGHAREVAQAGAWLASDEASFVTGIALPVDGGITAR